METSVFWPSSALYVHFSSILKMLPVWSLPMPTICRRSLLWRLTTCIVGLPWGDSSHRAALTRRQMYLSKCQHCHSEKILPTTCNSSLILLTAWLSLLLLWLVGWSWSVGRKGYLHNWSNLMCVHCPIIPCPWCLSIFGRVYSYL